MTRRFKYIQHHQDIVLKQEHDKGEYGDIERKSAVTYAKPRKDGELRGKGIPPAAHQLEGVGGEI